MARVYWDLTLEDFDHVALRVFQMRPEVEVTGQCNPPILGAAPFECMTLDEHYYVHRWTGLFDAREMGVQPIEVGIAPKGRDPERIAFVEAFALRCTDEECSEYVTVTRTAARLRFAEHHVTDVVLWLARSCIGVYCPAEHECRSGVCEPRDYDCELYDGGVGAPERCISDGGISPADAGPDTSPTDTGPPIDSSIPDAAPSDAGPGCPGECSPGQEERRGCTRCGTETRVCGADCRWGGWGSCQDQGECSRGESAGCGGGFDCSGCASGCCTTTCCRDCNDNCRWEWVCDMPCVDEPYCTNVFGTPVCEGQVGSNPAGCAPSEGQFCTCSGGAWTACDGMCRVL
jgi:hypothetical protein